MENIIRRVIKEIGGVSFVAREWVSTILQYLKDPNKHDRIEDNRVIIIGKDYPKIYENFPIDYLVVDWGYQNYIYLEEWSGYDENHDYYVYLNLPEISQVDETALNHEMKHAYQDYMRQSKGRTKISDTKEVKELYTADFVNVFTNYNRYGGLGQILKYYYFVSKLEDTAWLENVYDQSYLAKYYISTLDGILSKDFSSLEDDHENYDWNNLLEKDIPFLKKFKNSQEFIKYSEKYLKWRVVNIKKKINKMKYIHGIK